MALTKEVLQDKLEIIGKWKQFQIRDSVSISEDGKEISRSYTRRVLDLNDDLSVESQEIKDLADLLWTAEMRADWKAIAAAREAPAED